MAPVSGLLRTISRRESPSESSRLAHAAAASVRGLQAGFVATCIMTAFRLPIVRSLPPSAHFYAAYVGGGESTDHEFAGLLLHLAYGTSAGAIFGGLFALQDAEEAIDAEQRGLLWGSVFGMVLSAFGSQFLLKELLDFDLDAAELSLFHAAHLVYGLSLGAWVGSRTEGVEDPDAAYEYGDASDESSVTDRIGGRRVPSWLRTSRS